MFDENFNVFVWFCKDIKNPYEIVYQGVWRVVGDSGIEKFRDKMFNYACDGYNVEFSIFK